MKLLVLGIGNMLLTDDGVGVFAAQKLQEESWPDSVQVLDGGTFTQDIFYTFEGYTHILILDIIHTGQVAGTIHRLTADSLIKNDKQRLSIHDIDLIDSLHMAEMYFKQKTELLFLGVEPHDYLTWNIGLTPTLEAVFPQYLDLARQEIKNWIAHNTF